jgi:hypothetical protein
VYRTTWSIGYVEHACSQGLLPFAAIRNQAGNYVIPSAQSVAADAAWKPGITPADFSVVNQPGAASYRSAATAGRWLHPPGRANDSGTEGYGASRADVVTGMMLP